MPRRDELTGLLDGQDIERRLQRLMEAPDSRDSPLGLILADLGGLRNINLAHGREAGDQVLQAVAHSLEAAIGAEGMAFRLGGDAFIVLLPGFEPDALAVKARELREAIGATTVDVGGKVIRIDAYTGTSMYPDDATTPRALIRVADRKMKDAKPAAP